MSNVDDDTRLGLAAAARSLQHPEVTVSSLLAAITAGTLAAAKDDYGRYFVTLRDVKDMLAGASEAKSEIKVVIKKGPKRSK